MWGFVVMCTIEPERQSFSRLAPAQSLQIDLKGIKKEFPAHSVTVLRFKP